MRHPLYSNLIFRKFIPGIEEICPNFLTAENYHVEIARITQQATMESLYPQKIIICQASATLSLADYSYLVMSFKMV